MFYCITTFHILSKAHKCLAFGESTQLA